nr:hypothetical protein [Tanacetum cinerariifolium]
MATLNSKKIKERSKAKGDDGDGLYVRGRTDHRDSQDHLKRNCTKKNRKKSTGYIKKDEEPSSSGSTYDDLENAMGAVYCWVTTRNIRSEGYTLELHSSKVKVVNGSRAVLSGKRRENCVYSLDGYVVADELNISVDEKDSLAQ